MANLTFTDGEQFDTSGPYMAIERADGWYVVGGGLLCHCDSHAEAEAMVRELTVKTLAGEEVTICVAAVNRMEWDGVPVATADNLHYFKLDQIAVALRETRRIFKTEYRPMVDAILAKLEGGAK